MLHENMRHEYKYLINAFDEAVLTQRLTKVVNKDNNCKKSDRYKIRSLYFDNADCKAVAEKLCGVSNREKFRIRYYEDDLSFIRLEKKVKVNNLCKKYMAEISLDECKKILNGEYDFLKEKSSALLLEFYSKILNEQLRPSIIVNYVRKPFVYAPGNVRITIDSKISTSISWCNFLDKNSLTLPVLQNGISVLEVKYDNFIPFIVKDLIQTNHSQITAFSKYVMCKMAV